MLKPETLEREKNFIQKEKDRLDLIARQIADIIQAGQPSLASRYTWEDAYHEARELVSRLHHPG